MLLGAEGQAASGVASGIDIDDLLETGQMGNAETMHLNEGEFERSQHIRALVATLTVGIEAIEEGMSEIFELNDQKEEVRAELTILRDQIDDIMVPTVDNQLFYTMTGYHNLYDPPAARSEHFRRLSSPGIVA